MTAWPAPGSAAADRRFPVHDRRAATITSLCPEPTRSQFLDIRYSLWHPGCLIRARPVQLQGRFDAIQQMVDKVVEYKGRLVTSVHLEVRLGIRHAEGP